MTNASFGERMDRFVRNVNRWADSRSCALGRILARTIDLPVRATWHFWRNRNYLSIAKLFNMAVINVEMLFRRKKLFGRPYIIKIEPTNICNSTCRLCPTGMAFHGRDKGKMTFDNFTRIVDQVKRYAYVIDLSNWGDPLIVPDIYEMIRYVHDAGVWTYISSNLHAFRQNDGDPERLVRSGLDMLSCSLHGASQTTYEIYQPGKSFDQTIEKIRVIVETKRRLHSLTPLVRLFFVVTRYNEYEIPAFRTLAESLGCEVAFIPASLNLRFVGFDQDLRDLGWNPQQKHETIEKIKSDWLPENHDWIAPWYRAADHADKARSKPKKYVCDWPWRGVVINWDAGVSVCCGDFDPKCDMGNVLTTSLAEIWNNQAYQNARLTFRQALHDGTGKPCCDCSGVLI